MPYPLCKRICLPLLIACWFAGTVPAQQDTLWNQKDGNGWKQGFWKKHYPNGQLMYRGFFSDNEPLGRMQRFYEDGKLKAEIHYTGDSGIAYARMYFRNGQCSASGKYIGQERDSVWNYYSYYTGTLSLRETYRMGQKEGASIKFYQGGTKAEVLYWKEDRKHGTWEQFYEDSTLRLSAMYEMDRLNGVYRVYNPNRVLVLEGSYVNGQMEGDWKFYNDEGKMERILNYRSGELLNEEEFLEWVEEFMNNIEKNQGTIPEPDIENFMDRIP